MDRPNNTKRKKSNEEEEDHIIKSKTNQEIEEEEDNNNTTHSVVVCSNSSNSNIITTTTRTSGTANHHKSAISSSTTMVNFQLPKRTEIFTTESMWWTVDLHHNPCLTQGATPLVIRCMRVYGWSEIKARKVLEGYRQFIHLKCIQKDWDAKILSPSSFIDMMWHQHILDTANYYHDCHFLCGGRRQQQGGCIFLHHDPDDDGLVKNGARNNERRIKTTRHLLYSVYGSTAGAIDHDVWREVLVDDDNDKNDDDHDEVAVQDDRQEQNDDVLAGQQSSLSHVVEIDDDQCLILRIRDQTLVGDEPIGEETFYKLKYSTRLDKMFKAFAKTKGVELHELRFLYNGENIDVGWPYPTPKSFKFVDQDKIDAFLRLKGC